MEVFEYQINYACEKCKLVRTFWEKKKKRTKKHVNNKQRQICNTNINIRGILTKKTQHV